MPGLKVAEQHNSSVDERLVDLGLCGQTHLPSGHMCVLTARHSGGCVFVAREQAETLVT